MFRFACELFGYGCLHGLNLVLESLDFSDLQSTNSLVLLQSFEANAGVDLHLSVLASNSLPLLLDPLQLLLVLQQLFLQLEVVSHSLFLLLNDFPFGIHMSILQCVLLRQFIAAAHILILLGLLLFLKIHSIVMPILRLRIHLRKLRNLLLVLSLHNLELVLLLVDR